MKAILYSKYGDPDVMQLTQIEKPFPLKNEICVNVISASLNPLDWHFVRGTPYFMRLLSGLTSPRKKQLGADFSGIVTQVGENVSLFKPGDEVLGTMPFSKLGAFAEYLCLDENECVIRKPSELSHVEAAALPIASMTALQSIPDFSTTSTKPVRILINGSSGGVGTFAVQLAKAQHAHVTAVCSKANVGLVTSLGADEVIDYTQMDFTSMHNQYDYILDNVGNKTVSAYKKVLKPNGSCIIVGYQNMSLMMNHVLAGQVNNCFSKQHIGLMPTMKSTREALTEIVTMVINRELSPVIDSYYPLHEISNALSYLEKGHAKGKVIINIV